MEKNLPNTRTPEGRKQFDETVAKELLDIPLARGDVAKRMNIKDANGLRAVATSLKRGVRDGWARVEGDGSWAKYSRM